MSQTNVKVDVLSVEPMGAKILNRSRPLNVQLASTKQKWFLVGKSNLLRNVADLKDVFINPLLPLLQINESKKLHVELTQRRNSAEKNLQI